MRDSDNSPAATSKRSQDSVSRASFSATKFLLIKSARLCAACASSTLAPTELATTAIQVFDLARLSHPSTGIASRSEPKTQTFFPGCPVVYDAHRVSLRPRAVSVFFLLPFSLVQPQQQIHCHRRADEGAAIAENRDHFVQMLDLQAVVERVAEPVRPVEQRQRAEHE